MWSSTNQRIKALMSARAREKDRLGRPIHVRRADVVLSFRADDGFLVEVPARGLLNDFTPAGFCVYAATPLVPNVDLTLQIEHPKRFTLTAKVVWCQYQPSSAKILASSGQPFPYRVGLALIWKDTTVEAEFKKFCADLAELYVNKAALFIEQAFAADAPPAAAEPVAPTAAFDANGVAPPPVSDEGAAPSEEQVAAEMAAAKATEALLAANPPPAAAPAEAAATAETSAASVLDALKDFDPAAEEKKAA